MPKQLRHQQWSSFAERLPPMWVGDQQISVRATVRKGWEVLRNTLQSWGITSREHLTEWIHNSRFPATLVGSPLSGRAQDRILNGDARAVGLGGIREHRLGCVQTRTTGREGVAGREPSCRLKATCYSDAVGILG